MKTECCFIFIGPGNDPEKNTALIECEALNMCVTGVSDYAQAEEVAKKMVARGCGTIELCAGFGNEGIARIQRAVGPNIGVGAAKYDFMSAGELRTGDTLFS